MGIVNYAPKILDPVPGGKYLVNMIDYVVNWARANSIWPLTYGTSCCAIEMMSSSMARYDIARFGSEVFRASPRQADLFIIAGTITRRMAPALQMLWEQIPGPKYAIAMGACTISGGPFVYDNYSVVRGAQNLIPVDVFIPGCPPRPEALFHGLLTLREKILHETCRSPWKEGDVRDVSTLDRYREASKAWLALERIKDEEMAEARAKFKEENPEYKSAYKPVRVKKEEFPEVERKALLGKGLENGFLSAAEIFTKTRDRFNRVVAKDMATEAIDTKSEVESADDCLENIMKYPVDFPLELTVNAEDYLDVVKFMRDDEDLKMNFLIDVTGIDYEDHFEVITQLMSMDRGHKVFIRVPLKKNFGIAEEKRANAILAQIPSITSLYPAAEFKEREVYDMFGIEFTDHPDLRRIFLDEDFTGFPLRKDFTNPHMIRRPL
ncbi:MAG: NADH-quinone oxidoreductase subunit NuoB [Fibrobacteraceae bacterium]|nr:NADH-quinone oxidoreductase subunit NuoB [Fibrobacteraceae bacterium]